MGVKQGTRSQWNRWIILSPVFVFGPISFTIYKNTNYAKRCLLRKGFCFPFYEITRSQISLSLNLQHMYVKMSINLFKYNYIENVGKKWLIIGNHVPFI